MPQFFIYLLKVNIALCMFYAVYYVVLQKLTFYTLNRWFLIAAIFISSIFPILPYHYFFGNNTVIQQNAIFQYSPNWQQLNIVLANTQSTMGMWQMLYVGYWLGVIIMFAVFVAQLLSLLKLHTSTKNINLQYRQSNKNIAPFSFFKNIYINPSNHSAQALQSILLHEKVHAKQWHTIDLLLAEVNKIFYWFNPGVWLLKNAIKQNIEFIADKKVLQTGINAKQYQYELLHVITGTHTATAVATQFSFIHLKNRINMMNKQHSTKWSKLKYLLIIPVVGMVALVTAQKNSKQLPTIITTQVTTNDDFFAKVKATVGNSTKPVWVIDGKAVIVGNGVIAAFDDKEMAIDPYFKIWAAGKLYTMQQANETFNRFNLKRVGASPKMYAKQQYGINENLLIISNENVVQTNTIVKETFANYPIEFITINGITYAIAKDKNGKEIARFNLTNGNTADKIIWENMYGKIPVLPPPPPPPPSIPTSPPPPPIQLDAPPTPPSNQIVTNKVFITNTKNQKITIVKTGIDTAKTMAVIYYVDGIFSNNEVVKKINPVDISEINVVKATNSASKIYVVLKKPNNTNLHL